MNKYNLGALRSGLLSEAPGVIRESPHGSMVTRETLCLPSDVINSILIVKEDACHVLCKMAGTFLQHEINKGERKWICMNLIDFY